MSSKFKKGYIVKCVNNVGVEECLTPDKTYKVLLVSRAGYLWVKNDLDNSTSYFGSRFELAEKKEVESSQLFEVGDRVKCIKDDEFAKKNGVYTVTQVLGEVLLIAIDGFHSYCRSDNFVPIAQPDKTSFSNQVTLLTAEPPCRCPMHLGLDHTVDCEWLNWRNRGRE